MTEESINPFDVSSYSTQDTQANTTTVVEETQGTELPQQEPAPAEENNEPAQPIVQTNTEPAQPIVQTEETNAQGQEPTQTASFEWGNDLAKQIYDSLVNGDVSQVADIMYEQKVLSELDKMDENEVLMLKLAYDYPDLTPDEIQEEFHSKYSVDSDFDESLLTDEEIASKKKQIEKQQKAIAREIKKDVREAKEYLQTLKQDISFPDILSQVQQAPQQNVNPEEYVNQYLTAQQEEQAKAYQQARETFEKSVEEGLRSFDGFNVNYKDEDVQFDGKFSLTQEEKTQLQDTMKAFDLESFYGNRYYKEGKYDTKQLAEDIYFLQNRDKVVNSMVTQAVSKAKADLLKSMKNIDYSNSPRQSAAISSNDYDKMVDAMFNI
jgi:hypothetical protein